MSGATTGNGQKIGLQLVMPKNNHYGDDEHTNNGNGNNNIQFRKNKRAISVTSHYDGKLPSSRPVSFNRNVSYQPSIGGHSQASHSDIDHLIPPPSTEREKSKMTRYVLLLKYIYIYTLTHSRSFI